MRIPTAAAYGSTIEQLQRRQRDLGDLQQHIAAGKRVQRASDDPIAAARAERALTTESRSTAGARAVEASRTAMTQTESALGDAGDLLQQAREALVASGNGVHTDAQRSVLSGQLRDLRAQIFAIANRDDGAGGHLFGGQGSAAPPFVDAAGGVAFRGTRGTTVADAAGQLPTTMDGASVFLTAPTGNGTFETRSVTSTGSAWIDPGRVVDPSAVTGASYTLRFDVTAGASGGATTYAVLKDGVATAVTAAPYTAGRAIVVDGLSVTVEGAPKAGDTFELAPSTPTLGVFAMLDKAAADLATPLKSRGQVAQATSDNLRDIDAVLGRVVAARSRAGDALNRIAAVGDRLGAATLDAKTERAAAEDIDLVAAYSDFQNRQTGYDAALKSYAAVQRLSLFDYLKG